jgi:hypothetical protein
MRNVARILAGIAATGAVVLVCRLDAAPPAPKKAPKKTAKACEFCGNPQSPRRLTEDPETHWNWESTVPMVSQEQNTPDAIVYSPRPDIKQVMHPCSQHYHCMVENFQGCPGQVPSNGMRGCPELRPGNWVEIHTAYHIGPAISPLPGGLERCDNTKGKPVIVVGYDATVTSSTAKSSLPQHLEPPAAEWSGSSTNNTNDDPASCKIPAFWHFALGCNHEVSLGQLTNVYREQARALQDDIDPKRVSNDLTCIACVKKPR